jgi:hypothetical protein
MKLSIEKILDKGVSTKERLWLRALADCDLNFYLVLNTVYVTPNSIKTSPKHTYWFSKKPVKAGDYIVLYTGKGTESETKNKDGSTTYFLYWGFDNPIWKNVGDCAVLLELENWMTSKYE